MKASAVIFDIYGTLTKPNLYFDAIRSEIGVEGPILEAMERMDPAARQRAERILVSHEQTAAQIAELQPGAVEVIDTLRARGYPVAILTRNARSTVEFLREKFQFAVDTIRTREDGAIKPSAEPVLAICRQLQADVARSWMVGDYLFDLLSGRAAGTKTVLMIGDRPEPDFADQADFVIDRLMDLLPIVGVE